MTRRREADDFKREFEGYETLELLLAQSGALADAEDVAEAFSQAAKDGADAREVISDLWADEPHFSTPAEAARLFGNLLALFDLAAADALPRPGARRAPKVKQVKAERPADLGGQPPDAAWLVAAERFFDDFPKERERLAHAFDNRQDALVSWLDDSGLSDTGFGLSRYVLSTLFALLELGGRTVKPLDGAMIPDHAPVDALPSPLDEWLEATLREESADKAQLVPAQEAARVRQLVTQAARAMWQHS